MHGIVPGKISTVSNYIKQQFPRLLPLYFSSLLPPFLPPSLPPSLPTHQKCSDKRDFLFLFLARLVHFFLLRLLRLLLLLHLIVLLSFGCVSNFVRPAGVIWVRRGFGAWRERGEEGEGGGGAEAAAAVAAAFQPGDYLFKIIRLFQFINCLLSVTTVSESAS